MQVRARAFGATINTVTMVLRYHSGRGWISKKVSSAIRRHAETRKGKGGGPFKYTEPFTGMFRIGIEFIKDPGVIRHITLNDTNAHVYRFWKAVFEQGWLPDATPLSNEQYLDWKRQVESDDPLRTFYGHTLSLRGTMFDVNTPNAKYNKQPCMDAIRSRIQHLQSLVEKHPLHVRVCNADAVTEKYTDSIIYCDPPYFGARNHSWCDKAESRFWDAVYGWLSPGSGNLVYVSSHRELKKDHKLQLRCIWSQRMPHHCGGAGGYRIEYLYAVQRRHRLRTMTSRKT